MVEISLAAAVDVQFDSNAFMFNEGSDVHERHQLSITVRDVIMEVLGLEYKDVSSRWNAPFEHGTTLEQPDVTVNITVPTGASKKELRKLGEAIIAALTTYSFRDVMAKSGVYQVWVKAPKRQWWDRGLMQHLPEQSTAPVTFYPPAGL